MTEPTLLRWETLTKRKFDQLNRAEAVVLVTCSPLEVHGPHLPFGADALEGEGLSRRMLRFLPERHRSRTFLQLPFIYAAWTGRPGALSAADVEALGHAAADGLAHVDDIAAEYAPHDDARRARAARYLRDNVRYDLGVREREGLQRFLDYAADLGIAPRRQVRFY